MKRYFSQGLVLLCCLSTGCKKTQEPVNPPSETILQYIAKDPQLTILQAAITHSNLDTVFSSGGPFTIFCPVDSAFLSAGLTADKINAYNPDSLRAILEYSMVTGRFSSDDVVGFYTEQVTSLDSGYDPFIVKNYYGMFLNGTQVINTAELGDGVVQKIGAVNFPPTSTVLQLIDSLPELSFFAAVVNDEPQLQTLFSSFPTKDFGSEGQPGFTAFIPTNAAFAVSVYPTIASINQTDPTTLYNIFCPWIFNGFQFTPNFLGGWELNQNINLRQLYYGSVLAFAIGEDGTTILVGYPTSLSSGPSAVPPQITHPNILGTNGVIQEIDQVIL